MTEKSNLNKSEFVSPLNQYIETNCKKCQNWEHLTCSINTDRGIDRVFLCMIAATTQAQSAADVLKEALAAIEGSE